MTTTTTHATTTHPKETTTMSKTEAAPIPTTVHPTTIATAPAPAPAGGAPRPVPARVTSIDPPPASANIPSVPAGFTPARPGEFRTVAPRKSELAAMPQALIDLSRFASFDNFFAGIGLTRAQITQNLLSGSLWSSMRIATAEWDQYCVLNEGYAWRAIRADFLRLGQAFLLAAQTDPEIVTMYPGLAGLLNAKKSIAQRAASTRRLNSAAKAKGEPQFHGVVGKKRQRNAQKAALANAASIPAAAPPPAVPAAPSTPTDAVSVGAPNGVAR